MQRKIVAKLDTIFAEIEKASTTTEENIKNTEALFQCYLREVFQATNSGNKVHKVIDILKLEYGKGLDEVDREVDGIYPAYGANGIKSRTNKFLYDKPSIIVGRKGSAGELTFVNEKFWALDVTYYVTHDSSKTDLVFLYYALKMMNLPSLAKGIKPGISRNEVYNISVTLPTLSQQKQLVSDIKKIYSELEIIRNSYKSKQIELIKLKKSMLSKAFKGELVRE
jgi:type I restriction enzyme S subunit